jgi:hypothetical protein
MPHMTKSAFFVATVIALLAGSAAYAETAGSKPATDVIKESHAARPTAMAAAASDAQWPPAGCPDAATLRAFVNDKANARKMAYFGFYSTGNRIWLGTDHGKNVFNPNTPFDIPKDAQPFVIRWNISDTPAGGQPINANYALDYDAKRDGPYAVSAFAINQCFTDNLGNYGSCDQPVFGQAAWKDDGEYCPPIILSEDPNSIYLWSPNAPRGLPQVYDYSVALVLKGKGPNDPMAGLRLIIDPQVRNGGAGNR